MKQFLTFDNGHNIELHSYYVFISPQFSTIVNSFVLAFTSELVPKLVYQYYGSESGDLDGFTNWSLSKYPIANITGKGAPDDPFLNIKDLDITKNKFCR